MTNKQEKWVEEFEKGCNADNISDPPSDKEWIKDFIRTLISKERQAAYEQGRLRCLQHHYPEELENARKKEREYVLGEIDEIIRKATKFNGGELTGEDHELVDTCELYIPIQRLKKNQRRNNHRYDSVCKV